MRLPCWSSEPEMRLDREIPISVLFLPLGFKHICVLFPFPLEKTPQVSPSHKPGVFLCCSPSQQGSQNASSTARTQPGGTKAAPGPAFGMAEESQDPKEAESSREQSWEEISWGKGGGSQGAAAAWIFHAGLILPFPPHRSPRPG